MRSTPGDLNIHICSPVRIYDVSYIMNYYIIIHNCCNSFGSINHPFYVNIIGNFLAMLKKKLSADACPKIVPTLLSKRQYGDTFLCITSGFQSVHLKCYRYPFIKMQSKYECVIFFPQTTTYTRSFFPLTE